MSRLVNWMIDTFKNYFGGDHEKVATPEGEAQPNLHHLFTDSEILGMDCIQCTGKMVGKIGVDSIPPLAVTVMTTAVTIGDLVGNETVDWPGKNVLKKCYGTCLKKQMLVLNRLVTGGGSADTDHYFKRGNCNPHAVGMCYLLEKARECKMEVHEDGSIRANAPFKEGGDAQRSVCDAFKGVHLHLARDEEKGVICHKHHSSKMDLGNACHNVMKELMLYNEMCEATEEEGWQQWGWQKLGAKYEYKDERPINSWDQARTKCLELFGCDALRTNPEMPDLDAGIDAFKSSLKDIVSQAESDLDRGQLVEWVDKWRQASATAANAFEVIAQEWVAFHAEAARLKWARNDEAFENIFKQAVWKDHCFAFPKPITTKFDGLYKTYAKPDMGLFEALAEELGLMDWSESKCQIPKTGSSSVPQEPEPEP